MFSQSTPTSHALVPVMSTPCTRVSIPQCHNILTSLLSVCFLRLDIVDLFCTRSVRGALRTVTWPATTSTAWCNRATMDHPATSALCNSSDPTRRSSQLLSRDSAICPVQPSPHFVPGQQYSHTLPHPKSVARMTSIPNWQTSKHEKTAEKWICDLWNSVVDLDWPLRVISVNGTLYKSNFSTNTAHIIHDTITDK